MALGLPVVRGWSAPDPRQAGGYIPNAMPDTIRSVACTVCGCVCDDLTVTVENGRR